MPFFSGLLVFWGPVAMVFLLLVGPMLHARLREPCGVAARWGLAVATVVFLGGTILPIILTPDSNQGPLLGFFLAPTGFSLGATVAFLVSFLRGRKRTA